MRSNNDRCFPTRMQTFLQTRRVTRSAQCWKRRFLLSTRSMPECHSFLCTHRCSDEWIDKHREMESERRDLSRWYSKQASGLRLQNKTKTDSFVVCYQHYLRQSQKDPTITTLRTAEFYLTLLFSTNTMFLYHAMPYSKYSK